MCAVDPAISGVLVRGERGTAKTTAVRGLAPVLDGELVELPIGATADRVLGTLDLDRALGEGKATFQPGLLANAHEGLLYVDEVNLLPDHLVDVLLDAAALGRVHIERDGISTAYDARFLLVGTMNPEEGDLRPQLLDRFGLSVEVVGSSDPEVRVEIVRRRLAFDRDPAAFTARFAERGTRAGGDDRWPRASGWRRAPARPDPAADRRHLRPARRGRPPRRHRHRPHRHRARRAGRRRRGHARPRQARREARARPPPPPRPAPAAGARRQRAGPGAERLRADDDPPPTGGDNGRAPSPAARTPRGADGRPARDRRRAPADRPYGGARSVPRTLDAPDTPGKAPLLTLAGEGPGRRRSRARARPPASPSTRSPPRAP